MEHLARAELYKLGSAVGHHGLNALSPAYGGGELSHEVSLDFVRASVRLGVNILIYGAYRGMECCALDSFGELGTRRLHAG